MCLSSNFQLIVNFGFSLKFAREVSFLSLGSRWLELGCLFAAVGSALSSGCSDFGLHLGGVRTAERCFCQMHLRLVLWPSSSTAHFSRPVLWVSAPSHFRSSWWESDVDESSASLYNSPHFCHSSIWWALDSAKTDQYARDWLSVVSISYCSASNSFLLVSLVSSAVIAAVSDLIECRASISWVYYGLPSWYHLVASSCSSAALVSVCLSS